MRILLWLFFLLIAPQIFAGPFDPPATDKSVAILGTIFGNAVGDLYLGGVTNPVLYQMIEKLNFIIIAGGSLVVSYVSITSIIHTSHEGTMLGKSWSALWIPLRSIVGMSLLVPTPTTGYSLIQVSVMWLILQGIGIADELWTITMNGLADGVSAAVGTVTNPDIVPTGVAIAPNLLDAATCMQAVIKLANPNGDSFVYTHGTQIHSFDEIKNNITSTGPLPYTFATDNDGPYATVQGTMYFGISGTNVPQPDGNQVCGSTNITATVRLSEYPKAIRDQYSSSTSQTGLENLLAQQAMDIYKAKTNAYSQMIGVLRQVAQGYVNGTYAPADQPNSLTPPAPTGALADAAAAYANAMSGLVVPSGAQYITVNATNPITQPTQITAGTDHFRNNTVTLSTTSITDVSQATKDAIDAGNANGWISAGSFYFILNKTLISTQFASAADPYNAANFNIPTCGADQNSSCLNGIKTYGVGTPENADILNANIDQGDDRTFIARSLADSRLYATQESGGSVQSSGLGSSSSTSLDLLIKWDSISTSIINVMSGLFNGSIQNVDPLLAHAKFGRVIMAGCESVILNVIAMRVISAIFAAKPTPGLSSHGVLVFIMGILGLLMPLVAILWSFGAILALFCPLIPFMFFGVGALGWFITVVEAMIAAPIIAIGLLLPAGEDLGRTQGAMMILANLFFRPALMILGFLLAGKLYKAFVILVDTGLGPIFQTINVTTTFSIVVVVVIYVSLILSATNICFSLIYALPDRIFRWIGGHAEQTDAGPLAEIKGAAQDAGNEIGKGMADVGKSSIKSVGDRINKAAKLGSQGGKKNK